MDTMEEVTINTTADAIKVIKEALESAVSLLTGNNKVGVKLLPTIEDYKLTHVKGVLGIIYSGCKYIEDEDKKNSVVMRKRDILMGIVSIIRFHDDPAEAKNIMLPSDYPELAIDALAGIEVFNHRPAYENKIVPLSTELVNENGGVWQYLTTFSIPTDFIEKIYRT